MVAAASQVAQGKEAILSEEAKQDQQQIEAMFQEEFQEEDVYRAQELLLSATGSLKPVRLAPSVATVISKEEIEAMGAITLDEVLETVPGLHVYPNPVNIFSPSWSIRGVHAGLNPHVLLLINGIPLTYSTQGNRPPIFHMPVSMISRVEVVRGPGSAIHGADAFSGTVNVITKDGHEIDGTRTGLRYGSFDTVVAWGQHGGTYGGWDVVAGIESLKTKGDDERIVDKDYLHSIGLGAFSLAPGPIDTSYHQVDVHFGLNKDDRWIFRFYGSWQNDNAFGPSAAQAVTYGNRSDGRQFLGEAIYNNNHWFSHWELQFKANFVYLKGDYLHQFVPEDFLNMLGEPMTSDLNGGVEVVGLYTGLTGHKFRLATGVKNFDTDTDQKKNFGPAVAVQFGPLVNIKDTPYNYMENQHRRLWYLSAQDEWYIAKGWELTGGLRFDEYDDFGSTINPRLALVWETRYDLTSKLMYGRAFRSPSFGEQAFQNNPVTIGNPDLEPETIDTYELAFIWEPTKDLRITPSLFYYDIDGLIEYVPDPAPATSKTAQNAKEQKGRGFELDVDWNVMRSLRLQANLAYQRSKDRETGELVPDAPEWQFYANAHWSFLPEWSLDTQYFWIADRHRADGDLRDDIDDYSIVNLTLRRKNIADHWDVALAVRNLFNHDVREPSDGTIPNDYPMETRAIWGEVRFHF